jgi:sphingosine kinase
MKGVKQSRRVRLLINPVGGKGKARHLVNTLALPVFAAAGCPVEVIGSLSIHSNYTESCSSVSIKKPNMLSMRKTSLKPCH